MSISRDTESNSIKLKEISVNLLRLKKGRQDGVIFNVDLEQYTNLSDLNVNLDEILDQTKNLVNRLEYVELIQKNLSSYLELRKKYKEQYEKFYKEFLKLHHQVIIYKNFPIWQAYPVLDAKLHSVMQTTQSRLDFADSFTQNHHFQDSFDIARDFSQTISTTSLTTQSDLFKKCLNETKKEVAENLLENEVKVLTELATEEKQFHVYNIRYRLNELSVAIANFESLVQSVYKQYGSYINEMSQINHSHFNAKAVRISNHVRLLKNNIKQYRNMYLTYVDMLNTIEKSDDHDLSIKNFKQIYHPKSTLGQIDNLLERVKLDNEVLNKDKRKLGKLYRSHEKKKQQRLINEKLEAEQQLLQEKLAAEKKKQQEEQEKIRLRQEAEKKALEQKNKLNEIIQHKKALLNAETHINDKRLFLPLQLDSIKGHLLQFASLKKLLEENNLLIHLSKDCQIKIKDFIAKVEILQNKFNTIDAALKTRLMPIEQLPPSEDIDASFEHWKKLKTEFGSYANFLEKQSTLLEQLKNTVKDLSKQTRLSYDSLYYLIASQLDNKISMLQQQRQKIINEEINENNIISTYNKNNDDRKKSIYRMAGEISTQIKNKHTSLTISLNLVKEEINKDSQNTKSNIISWVSETIQDCTKFFNAIASSSILTKGISWLLGFITFENIPRIKLKQREQESRMHVNQFSKFVNLQKSLDRGLNHNNIYDIVNSIQNLSINNTTDSEHESLVKKINDNALIMSALKDKISEDDQAISKQQDQIYQAHPPDPQIASLENILLSVKRAFSNRYADTAKPRIINSDSPILSIHSAKPASLLDETTKAVKSKFGF